MFIDSTGTSLCALSKGSNPWRANLLEEVRSHISFLQQTLSNTLRSRKIMTEVCGILQSTFPLTHGVADTAMLTWKQEIVSAFRQPELTVVPQDFLSDNFDKQIEFVDAFYTKLSSKGESEAEREMHRVFVDSLLNESKTGIYSNFHNASLYERGYDHPETVRLAHM